MVKSSVVSVWFLIFGYLVGNESDIIELKMKILKPLILQNIWSTPSNW